MSINSILLQYLGQFHDHLQTMMVGTFTIAIMECGKGGLDTVVA